ncbi:putative reverse transcriptase domain-containing protein [Tanacetum coccineum]
MRQRRWIELFSDYDCKIRYHPGKANVVADALSRKERVKPKRVRAMNMTLQSSIKDRILAAQKEACDKSVGLQKGLDEMIKLRSDGALYYPDRIWVPSKGDVRTLIIDEAHKSKYSVHPGADKMYYDLRDKYWWSGIKKDIVVYDYKMDRLARLYLNEIVSRHGVLISIISDRDSRFTSRGSWDVHLLLVEFLYNNSYHSSVRCAPFEALYGRKCRSPIMWAEDRLKAARDHQKSYADKRRKPLEFSVGPVAYRLDLLKVLYGVHDTFHVSNLKKCLADPTLQVPLDEIQVDSKFNFVERPV